MEKWASLNDLVEYKEQTALFRKVPVTDILVSKSQTTFESKTLHVFEGNAKASLRLKINQTKNGYAKVIPSLTSS